MERRGQTEPSRCRSGRHFFRFRARLALPKMEVAHGERQTAPRLHTCQALSPDCPVVRHVRWCPVAVRLVSGPLSGPLSGGVREGVRNPVRNVRSVSGDVRSILDSMMCTHVRCCPVFSPVMYGGVPRWYPARPTVRQYALKLYLFAMACVQLAPDSLGKRLSKDLSGSKGRRECAETR